jgi:proteasome assembly chaperone (PAC2) family protein
VWERIEEEETRPTMKDPILLVALSTSMQQYKMLYSQARELGKFMLKKMDFKKLATVYSSSLPPLVVISAEGLIRLSSASFYHYSGQRDIVLLAGDSSPVEDQYEFCKSVLEYAAGLGIHEVVSIGARWTEEALSPIASPKVNGFATDAKGVKELEGLGVEIIRDEPAPYFASLVLAQADRYGFRGYKLSVDHGEPVPHPKGVIELLSTLQKMMGFKLETGDLDEAARKLALNLESSSEGYAPDTRPGIYG